MNCILNFLVTTHTGISKAEGSAHYAAQFVNKYPEAHSVSSRGDGLSYLNVLNIKKGKLRAVQHDFEATSEN